MLVHGIKDLDKQILRGSIVRNDWSRSSVGSKGCERQLGRNTWARTLRALEYRTKWLVLHGVSWKATLALELHDRFDLSKDHPVQRPRQFLIQEEPARGKGRHWAGTRHRVEPMLWLETPARIKRPYPLPVFSLQLMDLLSTRPNVTSFHHNH